MRLGGFTQRIIRQAVESIIYDGQIARLEWIDTTDDGNGLALDSPSAAMDTDITGYQRLFDQTPQTSASDTHYLFCDDMQINIHIIKESDVRMIKDDRIVVGDAIVMLPVNINLKAKPKLRIVQMPYTLRDSGTATISIVAGTFTDSAKSWTVNQWKGYDLVLSDRRFPVLSNTATVLTVDLLGCGSFSEYRFSGIELRFDEITQRFDEIGVVSYTLIPTIVWFPKLWDSDLGGLAGSLIGNTIAAQTILCSRAEV